MSGFVSQSAGSVTGQLDPRVSMDFLGPRRNAKLPKFHAALVCFMRGPQNMALM
jgi:hypothetical protein